ncbi:TonB-dependent receptor plug domain-containing protein [Acinetobacter courvalinii]|uniref:TonB-dependent receptor n=1 Tax=Acinetobacter courvalinii TaxID=280147 RepID=A0AA42IAP8_9GAMM|nr:TonB-dependent receptor [Acinetobacter courvalinii]MDH0565396.1 TonB-dependent receptor [Acinetobacter courvalinii]
MSTVFQPTRLVGAIAIAMGFSSPAFAQDQASDKTATLDTIVVTASRSEQKIEDVPARINVINEKTIQQSPLADLGHLLQRDAGLHILQQGGMGQNSSLFIRGTNSNHSLFLKDGARLNTALDGGTSIPYIDLSDVNQIEILKGPASVQYGTDAIGGVINVRTAPPKQQKLFLTTEAGENKTYKSIVGADLVSDNGLYAQIRGQRQESDGTNVTNKSKKKASYDQKGYSTKIGYEQDQYGANVSINENKGTNVYYGGSHDFFNRLINTNAYYQILDNLKINAHYSNFKDELTGKSSTYYFDTERNEGDINLQWNFTKNQNLLVGASINNADVKSLAIKGEKQSLDSTGYYVQHQYNDQNGLSTQAGIRIEDNDQFGTKTVGQIAGRIQIAPLTSVYANIGTAFKAPTGNQLYYSSQFKDEYGTYITVGNPDLKPEESLSYEIGIDQKLAYGLSAYASAYHTKVKNLIQYVSDYDPVNQISAATYNNVNKAKMFGGEVGLKWKQDDLFLTTEYGYVKTENEESGYELVRRPRQSLTLTAGLENELYGLSTSLVAKSHSKISESKTSKYTPGYATVDLNAYWNVSSNVKLFTNIANVGDVRYKTANFGGDEFYISGGRLASAGVTFRY